MRTQAIRATTSIFGLIGLAMLAPAPAFAQADEASVSSEIVVTAQRREERSVDVPITVTTLGEQVLKTANVQELSDISKITPSLRFDNQAAFAQPTIRGVGTGITTSGGGSNVGIYVDGFYSPNPLAADFQLMNVRSIQVLKGPQGTLFGRNTTGGAILVQTADPSTDTSAQAKVSYARFNEVTAQGYATFGISARVAIDVEGIYRRGDGFVRNLFNGKRDGEFENWGVRLGVKGELTDTVSVMLRYAHNNINDPTSMLTNANIDPVLGVTAPNSGVALPGFKVPNSVTSDPDLYNSGVDARYLHANSDVVQLTVKADLGIADLTSYSQYRNEQTDMSEDLDQVGDTIFQLGLNVPNEVYSQEFLLTSKPGPKLQWTAGLFYFNNRDTYDVSYNKYPAFGIVAPVRSAGGSSTTTQSYAAFLDATYEVSPQFFFTAGVRYAHDTVTDGYYISPFSFTKTPVPNLTANRVTPRVVLRYKPSDKSSIYASYTRGYKAGVIDVGGASSNTVKPETIDAFEVGYKFSDRALSFEAAGYYYKYKNLQVSLFKQATAQLVNAATSEIYGAEGQLRYDFDEHFQVNLGASWTHARYTDFPDAPIYTRCPTAAGCGFGTSFFILPTNLKDVHMQRSPDFTGNIGARYRTTVAEGELVLSGNLYYTSKFYYSPSGTQFPQNGYEVLTLRAQWTDPSDHYSLAVFGDNVTNSRYRTQVQYNNFGIGATWSAPVTYGVEVGVKF